MRVFSKLASGLLLMATSLMAQIQHFGDEVDIFNYKGSVDWQKRTIVAVGIGAVDTAKFPQITWEPMAKRAAYNVALRNALEIIKGVQLNSNTTVENFMVSSDVIRTQVEGEIRGHKVKEYKFMSNGTVRAFVEIPLTNTLSEKLLPAEIAKIPAATSAPAVKPQTNVNFTGLIIDARGLKVTPAMVPVIYDENGKEVYGSAFVKREFSVKWGMAGYAASPKQAAGFKDRIGTNPGIIKAVAAKGAAKSDLVISNSDAESVRAAAQTMKFLADCRVIIVVD